MTANARSLVPIKPSGCKRPFFYIHGADGHTIDSLIGKYIDPDRPFYGLRAVGRDGKEPPHTCVEEMAAYYIQEIQTVQPEGPYVLGGRCTGGNIAFEMAQQLKKCDQKVLSVVMVDSPRPLLTEVEKVEYRDLMSPWKETMLANISNLSSVEVDFDPKVFEYNSLIPINYAPQIYSGRVVYFAAQEKGADFFSKLLQPNDWNRWVVNGVEVYEVPGDHLSMTKEPHVRVLAKELSDCLDRAEYKEKKQGEGRENLSFKHSINQQLEEKGYKIIDFFSDDEVLSLLKFYKENSIPRDLLEPVVSATICSLDLSYRRRVTQETKRIFIPKLEFLFPNHKVAGCTFITKKSDRSYSGIDLHQDQSFADETNLKTFGVWCPLIDVNEQNGCFQVVQKSHWLNSTPRSSNGFPYSQEILSLMKQDYLTSVPMKAGQALVYDNCLFHGSFPNLTSAERVAVICVLTPKDSPVLFYYRDPQVPHKLETFKVDDGFYDSYIQGEKPANAVSLGVVDYQVNPITPEQLMEFMDASEINANEDTGLKGKLLSFFNLLRGNDWWFYKIPPLLAIAYAEILLQAPPPEKALVTLLALLASMFFVAAYGHVVNDIFDIEVDRRAHKPNRMAALSTSQRLLLCSSLAVAGLVPWLLTGFSPQSALLLAGIYTLLTIYSAPPLRLKERGFWGVMTDAAAVHAVPTLFVATVLSQITNLPQPESVTLASVATLWAALVGIRGIVLHQIWDRENDVASGVNTLVVRIGVEPARSWLSFLIFPCEILLLGLLVFVISQFAPLLGGVFTFYVILRGINTHLTSPPVFDPAPAQKAFVPAHDFYEVWLPLTLLVLLSIRDASFIPLLALHITLFYPAIARRLIEFNPLLLAGQQIVKNFINSMQNQFIKASDDWQLSKKDMVAETFLELPSNELENSVVKAVNFLIKNQLDDGEFPTYEDSDEKLSKFDSSPFATSLILYSLSFLSADNSESKVKNLISKGLQFLRKEMEFGGLWRYWSSKNPKHQTIPPDLDDISCISHILKLNSIPFKDNTDLILANRNKAGIFYTWILPRSVQSVFLNLITFGKSLSNSDTFWTITKTEKDDICCVVNSNVLLYLGDRKETQDCVKYLLEVIQEGKEYENTEFYSQNLSFYYMLSRAYYNGVKSIGAVKTLLINRVLAFQGNNGSFGDELLTALGVCTLLNLNYVSPQIDRAIDFILEKQQLDGFWRRIAMFGGKRTQHFFGSEALTTGFCVEALTRYRLLNSSSASERKTLNFLTPQMQKELEEYGYVVLDNFLSEAELQDLQEFDRIHLLPDDIAALPTSTNINCSNLFYRQKISDRLKSIINPKLITLLPNCRAAFCTWYRKSPNSNTNATQLHQDPSLTTEPDTLAYGIWCPLIDVDSSNGCLHVIKGSHKLNSQPRPFHTFSPFPYDNTIATLLNDHYLTHIPLKAGQAILYDKRLFHGATANPTLIERVAFTCLICPTDLPTHFGYRPSPDFDTIELFEVQDDFYNRYILVDKPSGNDIKSLGTFNYKYDPITPEILAKKLNPLHPQTAPTLDQAQLNQLEQVCSELQTQCTELQAEAMRLKAFLQTQGSAGLMNYYRHAIATHPDDLPLYYQALEVQPDDAHIHLQLGNALVRQGQLNEAIARYQIALQYHPDNVELHLELGKALEQATRWDEAITAYRRAIDLNPNHSLAHQHLGDALAERGQLHEASLSYRHVLQLQ